jgi:nucleoside-diphosphate-sugar epimerase
LHLEEIGFDMFHQIKNKRIIVTGGAGFIGSNIVDALAKDNEVVVIDNLITGRLQNILKFSSHIKFAQIDINDLGALKEEFEFSDYVLHQAALPSVQRSVKDPNPTNYNNVNGTLSVLTAARDCGVKRVVFASSSSVYGNTGLGPKTESLNPNPISPYAVSKLIGEHYCKIFYELYGLETVVLRYFNVFGPNQDPYSEYAAVIPKFIKAVRCGEPPIIYGDGEQSRDFTYVENVVLANILACKGSKPVGEVMNIACGERTTLNRIIQYLDEILDSDINPMYTEQRPGDIRDSLADISKARRLLGYSPKYSLKDGLKMAINNS